MKRPAMAKRRPCPLPAQALLIFSLSWSLCHAQTLIDARLSIKPDRPVINQWCRLELVIETRGATSLRNLRLQGLPDTSTLTMEPLQEQQLERRDQQDGTIEIRRYQARVRPRKPGSINLQPMLHADLEFRASSGFVTRTVTQRVTHRLPVLQLSVQPWPSGGKPDGFEGAVGRFSVQGSLAPADPLVGDLIRLTVTIEGEGWLDDAMPRFAPPPPAVQAYTPIEVYRDPAGRLRLERVFVATNTTSTAIPGATFAWYDPSQQAYRIEHTGAFPIQPRERDTPLPPTRQLHIEAPPTPAGPSTQRIGLPAISPLKRFWTVLPGLGVLLATHFLTRWRKLKQLHPHLPSGLRLAGLLGGLALSLSLDAGLRRFETRLAHSTTVRIGPARQALALTEWPADQPVRIYRQRNGWARVGNKQLIGWIPAAALQPVGSPPAAPRQAVPVVEH